MIVEEINYFSDTDKIKKAERFIGIRAQRFGYDIKDYTIDNTNGYLTFVLTCRHCPDIIVKFTPDFTMPTIFIDVEKSLTRYGFYKNKNMVSVHSVDDLMYVIQKATQLANTLVDYSD